MIVVGITGRAQHGKDTIGQLLVEEYGFQRYGFADQLKELALRVDPWITTSWGGLNPAVPDRLSRKVSRAGWEDAKQNPEVRRTLQELGTSVRDIIGPDAWVNALLRQVLADAPERVVITDVRFPNEQAFVYQKLHGWMFRVTRPGFDNGVDPNHPSELHVPQLTCDMDFENSLGVEELLDGVRAFMDNIVVPAHAR